MRRETGPTQSAGRAEPSLRRDAAQARGKQAAAPKPIKVTQSAKRNDPDQQRRSIQRITTERRVRRAVATLDAKGADRLSQTEGAIEDLKDAGVLLGRGTEERRVGAAREKAAREAPPLTEKRNIVERLLNPFDQSDTKNTAAGNRMAAGNRLAARPAFIPNAATTIPGLAIKNTALSIVKEPVKQTKRIPGDVAKSVIAIPAGLYKIAKDPKQGAKDVAKDYSTRYGPLTKGPEGEKAFRERQSKEGVTAELFDAAAVGSAGGATLGRAAQGAARTGKLGGKLKRVAVEPRPDVQVSAGKTRPQALSPNLLTNVAAKRLDKRRAKAVERRLVRRPDAKDLVDVEASRLGNVRPVVKARRAQIERKASARLDSASRVTMKGELNRTSRKLEIDIAKKLGKDEQRGLTYAVKFGIRSPAQARRVLTLHAAQIRAERAANPDVSLTPRTDQLPEIERLIADADKVFTANVARVADGYGEASKKAGAADPGLKGAESQRVRAVKPLAELQGVKFRQGETSAAARSRAAKQDVKRAALVKTDAALQRRIDSGAKQVEQARAAAKIRKLIALANRASTKGENQAAAVKIAVLKERYGITDLRAVPDGVAALRDVEAAKAQQVTVRRDLQRTPAGDPRPRRPESNAEFLERADTATPKDLAEPAYFKGEKRAEFKFGAFTRGSGVKAKPKDKKYKGSLSRTGRESGDPAVLVRSLAGNISRRYNWQFVRDNIRDGSPEWARNKDRSELLDEADRRGIDPDSFVLVRHQIIDRDAKLADEKVGGGDVSDDGDFAMQASIHEALKEASLPGAKAADLKAAGSLDLNQNSGWTLMSKARHNEMMSNATPSGSANRKYTVAKGKVSRLLLGTPGWLQFQMASNAFLTGLSGTGPVDFAKAQVWWKQLPEEQRAALEPLFGITPFFDEQTKLGATANGKITNAWRGLKTTGLYNHALNPTTVPRRTLDALFRADNAQNNAFRKAVLYSQVKRDAYARMGASAQNIIRVQDTAAPSIEALAKRAGHLKDLGPKRMMAESLKDQAKMEKHAEYVRDFLGDYVTYSARERRFIGKSAMFYGFLRFSLRFTFYTMPAKHPVMSSIGLQLGRMQIDELERIFGTSLPPWELANFYSADGKKRVNIGRMVPFLNASSYFNSESGAPTAFNAALASLPPYVQTAMNFGLGRDVAKDKNPTVAGDKYYMHGTDVSLGDRVKIAAAELANLPPVLRLVKKTGIPGVREPDRGKQTSESSLFNPDPRVYTKADKIAENEQRKLEDAKASPFREFLAPLVSSTDGRKIIRASQERAPWGGGKEIVIRPKAAKRVKRTGPAALEPLPALPPLPPLPVRRR